MSDTKLEISIPLDDDGFIEMECDYCKSRFMLPVDVYEDDNNINFFCPVCGLPNRINTFFVPEVLELAKQKAMNYEINKLEKEFGKAFKKINKGGFIKMSMKKTHKEPERDLYKPTADYIRCHERCCNIDLKVLNFDKETGIYCPVCGRIGCD